MIAHLVNSMLGLNEKYEFTYAFLDISWSKKEKIMKNTFKLISLFVLLAALVSACAPAATPAPTQAPTPTPTSSANMPNPAAAYCQKQGYTSEIRTAADGSQSGVCKFTDGTECDEWAYFRRDCSPAQQIQVTVADQGKNFTLHVGDSLVIVLDSNPSTGYNWVVKSVDNPVLSQSGEPVFKTDSKQMGAPGNTTFTFKTMSSGFQVLTLLYQRPFEKDAQPLKTFTINVTVAG